MQAKLTKELFNKLRDFVYRETAISLGEHKFSMLQSRLQRRLIALGLDSYDAYYNHITNGQNSGEITYLIDAISTNVTSFFREVAQWTFLEQNIDQLVKWHQKKGKLRIWSSACSSGQEPYSIAMFLLENMPNAKNMNIKILATDISNDILKQATAGVYTEKEIGDMPAVYKNKYFTRENLDSGVQYRITPQIKEMVVFRQFNLTRGNFSMFSKTNIDIIFCRNVMIYFDAPTKEKLFDDFHRVLSQGTMLFIGHSESISGNMLKKFKLLRSSIYTRL